ncbi:MAG: TRAP transporter permease [Candidatus Thiodiazotropha sp. (ex Semelilucina semeliformis)]|nr:TRAP transporter permease [Candidatus Thiodiazotropha sp. (ex Semelilucina semeliformis)]
MNQSAGPSQLEVIEASEYGGRQPAGWAKSFLLGTALVWALFQLWVASPLPFVWGIGVFNDTEIRSIHLAFAIFLVYLSFPRKRGVIVHVIPWIDWLLALLATFCAAYLYLFYEQLADRAGAPTTLDVTVAVAGVLLLLEATRRALGWPLTVIAGCFLIYSLAGPWLPDLLAHKGASLQRLASHQWLSTEGVFGVAVGVSAGFVFLFVLFGSLLEQAGGGHYFIRVAYSLVGHMRGGPAKAGVLASGLTGMVSGSSIANVVTTGTFTIPLMKKVGFSAEKSGAIEVAASTNGQIMPPVMGAAAFLMVEYLNLSYLEVIKHAFLPAVLSYIALMYLVHLEAIKSGMQGTQRQRRISQRQRLLSWGLTLAGTATFFLLAYLVIDGVNRLFGDLAFYLNSGLIIALYVVLIFCEVRCGLRQKEREAAESLSPQEALLGGLHYLLPILVLVWCLMLLRLSPATAVFYAICLMIFIQLTQEGLRALFAGQQMTAGLRQGFLSLVKGLENGARNMIGIGVATATAGIVVGTVSLTGIGQVLGELIETLSLGSVFLMLLLTAIICMILGMGLPTTANYIVVSTLMAPVIVQLSASHGLEIPLVAVHMFVFYFGILADDTPPVGLAAYAAAGISGGDPIRTGLQSFYYDIRTAILPFMFIFNTELLLIGVESVVDFIQVAGQGLIAILLFVSATQGWLMIRNRWWETVLLLVIAFSLFRPDFWRDQLFPAYDIQPAAAVETHLQRLSTDDVIRLQVEVEQDDGSRQLRDVLLALSSVSGEGRLQQLGFITEADGDSLRVNDIAFMSPAESAGLEPGYTLRISGYYTALRQPDSGWFLLPPLLILGGIVLLQLRRKDMK